MAASVKMKHSMVAMSGAIMPAPLQKPLMATGTPPISAVRVASLGKVSVVMMARARDLEGVGLGRLGEPIEQVRELAGIQRLADDARRGDEDLARRCSRRPWRPPPP